MLQATWNRTEPIPPARARRVVLDFVYPIEPRRHFVGFSGGEKDRAYLLSLSSVARHYHCWWVFPDKKVCVEVSKVNARPRFTL
jgi:hypothetical protein